MKISYERLFEIAKAMFVYIFYKTNNEEKAYKQCGLTQEEIATFGLVKVNGANHLKENLKTNESVVS